MELWHFIALIWEKQAGWLKWLELLNLLHFPWTKELFENSFSCNHPSLPYQAKVTWYGYSNEIWLISVERVQPHWACDNFIAIVFRNRIMAPARINTLDIAGYNDVCELYRTPLQTNPFPLLASYDYFIAPSKWD